MLAELRVTPVGAAIEFARLIASVLRVVADTPLQYQMHEHVRQLSLGVPVERFVEQSAR